jgi:hypothetical protein
MGTKIYCTKYALTRGILELEADSFDRNGYAYIDPKEGNKGYEFVPAEWEGNKKAAIHKANYMKRRKILLLERQIMKFRKMRFN